MAILTQMANLQAMCFSKPTVLIVEATLQRCQTSVSLSAEPDFCHHELLLSRIAWLGISCTHHTKYLQITFRITIDTGISSQAYTPKVIGHCSEEAVNVVRELASRSLQRCRDS